MNGRIARELVAVVVVSVAAASLVQAAFGHPARADIGRYSCRVFAKLQGAQGGPVIYAQVFFRPNQSRTSVVASLLERRAGQKFHQVTEVTVGPWSRGSSFTHGSFTRSSTADTDTASISWMINKTIVTKQLEATPTTLTLVS